MGLSLFSSAAAAIDTCLPLTALVVAYVVFVLASPGLAKVTVKISVVVHFFSRAGNAVGSIPTNIYIIQ